MHHQTTPTAIALILATCLLLTGCSAEALQKNRLRQDPLYTATWDGIESLGTKESTDGAWKPPPPSITRCLKTTLPPEEAVQRIMTTAKQENWTEDEPASTPATSRWARKEKMQLYISAKTPTRCKQYPETNLVTTFTIAIN